MCKQKYIIITIELSVCLPSSGGEEGCEGLDGELVLGALEKAAEQGELVALGQTAVVLQDLRGSEGGGISAAGTGPGCCNGRYVRSTSNYLYLIFII